MNDEDYIEEEAGLSDLQQRGVQVVQDIVLAPSTPKGYPAGLALDLILSALAPEEVLASYKITTEQFVVIAKLPAFKIEMKELSELAKEEGFSYKMKARAQAEGMLQTTWTMIQDQTTPAAVRADLIKFMTRVAGYDKKESREDEGVLKEKISITINLGSDGIKTINP